MKSFNTQRILSLDPLVISTISAPWQGGCAAKMLIAAHEVIGVFIGFEIQPRSSLHQPAAGRNKPTRFWSRAAYGLPVLTTPGDCHAVTASA